MDQVEYLAPDVVNGLNLYAYCLNNPVMSSDPEGTCIGSLVKRLVKKVRQFVVDAVKIVQDTLKELTTSSITVDDLNINESNPKAKIKVDINAYGIEITDSYKITKPKDRERIIEIIMDSKVYKEYGYYRSKNSYLKEWTAHNRAYHLPEFLGIRDNAQSVYLDKDPEGGLRGFFYNVFGW